MVEVDHLFQSTSVTYGQTDTDSPVLVCTVSRGRNCSAHISDESYASLSQTQLAVVVIGIWTKYNASGQANKITNTIGYYRLGTQLDQPDLCKLFEVYLLTISLRVDKQLLQVHVTR